MEFAYYLHGGVAPLKMGFQVNETLADAGIPVLAPGAGNAGVQISTTTSMANAVGVTLDTATYVTAQQTDGTSAEREVDVIISPSAVFRVLMSGGAAEGTALTRYPVTTASATGLVVTTSSIANWASPQWDEGVVWFDDGANVGQKRKVTSVSGTAATVTVAFDQDTVVGDNALRAPWWFLDDGAKTLQTTTLLYQADASIAVGTGGAFKIIDMELNSVADSFVLGIFDDHALRETT
jgi:hypothetical protein